MIRPGRTLSHDEARRVYDRIGARQDSQAFYEDRATAVLLAHGGFREARRVFELGCGTGRLAERLLEKHLPSYALYRGVDLSPRMVELARARLARFAPRAEVRLSDGDPHLEERNGEWDRWLSSFVLDLLSEDEIAATLREAHRILRPGGLLCAAGLSGGTGPISRASASLWSALHRVAPRLVGGCRPLELSDHLPRTQWRLRRHEKLAPYGIPSEAVVAERI